MHAVYIRYMCIFDTCVYSIHVVYSVINKFRSVNLIANDVSYTEIITERNICSLLVLHANTSYNSVQ